MKFCATCSRPLRGRQSKFCFRKWKNDDTNNRLQSYASQQRRGRRRKIRLIALKGSQCANCGYGTNFAALEFHHSWPSMKAFTLDLRSLSNRRWNAVLEEAEKCVLLCSNCHKETHNPECKLPENITSKTEFCSCSMSQKRP